MMLICEMPERIDRRIQTHCVCITHTCKWQVAHTLMNTGIEMDKTK